MLKCEGMSCSRLQAVLPSARMVDKAKGADFRLARLTHSSSVAGPDSLFFALPGERFDGADFIQQAFAAGAPVAVSEREVEVPEGHVLFIVDDARAAMASIAVSCKRDILSDSLVVGVTGTNGKTTTCHFIRSIISAGGFKSTVVGTTGIVYPDGSTGALQNTTPDILKMLSVFSRGHREGCRHFVLEASSQGLIQRRVMGIPFRVGVFTNLTPDHIEVHGSQEAYLQAKLSFFSDAARAASSFGLPFFGCVWGDSSYSEDFIALCPGPPFIFGCSHFCDVRATEIECGFDRTRFLLSCPGFNQWVVLKIKGMHNVLNALAAASAALALGLTPSTIVRGLEGLENVPGRLEGVPGKSRRVLVDYAHSSDAMEKLLTSCRAMIKEGGARLVVVFGCGGDRDKAKRPLMGALAASLADRVYVTSDNPRSEEPELIIDDILSGIGNDLMKRVSVETDRRKAIRRALFEAETHDLIVIAGKGHEDYQVVGDKVIHFDDLEEAAAVLKELDDGLVRNSD